MGNPRVEPAAWLAHSPGPGETATAWHDPRRGSTPNDGPLHPPLPDALAAAGPTFRPGWTARAASRPRAPTLSHIWLALPAAAAWMVAATAYLKPPDLFFNLAAGRWIAQRGQIALAHDPFTYAPLTLPFINQPWLAQLAYWWAYDWGGYAGVIALNAAAVAAGFGLLTWLAHRESRHPAVAAGLALLALVLSLTNLGARPQTLALPLFVAVLAITRLARPGRFRDLLLAAGVAAVWANTHGSFVLAVALPGLHFLGALLVERRRLACPRVRHLAALATAAGLGTLANPQGPLVWWYVVRLSGDSIVRNRIWEWQPTSLADPTGRLFFASLPIVLWAFVAPRPRPRPTELLLLGAFGWLALSALRGVVWWGLVLPPLLGTRFASALPRRTHGRERPILNVLLALVLVTSAALAIPWLRPISPLRSPVERSYLAPGEFPSGAAAYLASTQARGRLFTSAEWGGYLAFEEWPRLRVFLDARIEQHPSEAWEAYFRVLEARPGWEATLEELGADYLLVDRKFAPDLVARLDQSPRWRRAYQDERSIVYAPSA